VVDRISVTVEGPTAVAEALAAHGALIAAEALADEVELGEVSTACSVGEVGDGQTVRIAVRRVGSPS
jgi:hypothetical protein